MLNSNFDEENDEDDNSSGIDDEGLAGGLGPLLGGVSRQGEECPKVDRACYPPRVTAPTSRAATGQYNRVKTRFKKIKVRQVRRYSRA